MPPLASRYLRRAVASNDMDAFGDLIAHQFIDATEIWDMANHAACANRSVEGLSGRDSPPFSEMAVLPARKVWIEIQGKAAFACVERDGGFSVRIIKPSRISPMIIVKRGETDIAVQHGDWREGEAAIAAELVEAILCIINQPGLTVTDSKPMDRRVERAARITGNGSFALWVRCSIRPGKQGRNQQDAASAFAMPLHYVRKHFKPKASAKAERAIWIDGYWRGDKDMGVLLKTYVPQLLAA